MESGDEESFFVAQRAIKRSHLLKALNSLVYGTDTLEEQAGPRDRATKHCCSLDLSRRGFRREITSKKQILMFTLRNAISRHDWSTAAQCIHFLLDISPESSAIYRSMLIILFNHPDANDSVIEQFLSEVLNLRTKQAQSKFLGKCFTLPHDLDQYCCHEQNLASLTHDEMGIHFVDNYEEESYTKPDEVEQTIKIDGDDDDAAFAL